MATLLSLGASIVGARFGRIFSRAKAKEEAVVNMFASDSPIVADPIATRLYEVKSELLRQKSISTSARLTTWGLTMGQYIVGGLLASSFLQEQLPHQFAGSLGVLVLLSTLIYQNFRPDRQMRLAEIKKVRLRALYRTTEDEVQAIKDKVPTAATAEQIRRRLTAELSAIEGLQFEEERPKSDKIEQLKKGDGHNG